MIRIGTNGHIVSRRGHWLSFLVPERGKTAKIRGPVDIPQSAWLTPGGAGSAQACARFLHHRSGAPSDPCKEGGQRHAQSDQNVPPIRRGEDNGVVSVTQHLRREPQIVRSQGRTIASDQEQGSATAVRLERMQHASTKIAGRLPAAFHAGTFSHRSKEAM